MQRAMRIKDNPALDVAIEAGNLLGLPVVIYFQVIPNYPHANLRHYYFLQQGLRDVAEEAAERELTFVIRRSPAKLEEFLEEVRAAFVIGDENPCREPERWRDGAGGTAEGSFLDRGCRRRGSFARVRAEFCVAASLSAAPQGSVAEVPGRAPRRSSLFYGWKSRKTPSGLFSCGRHHCGVQQAGPHVGPVDCFTGGTHSALKRLEEFVRSELKDYEETRNHPEARGTSRLSPYLHFGNISPLTIALAVKKAVAAGKASAAAGRQVS